MKKRFEEFNDGIVDVYHVNDEDQLEKMVSGLRFGNENVGIARHYAARAADTRVDRIIHILKNQNIKPHQVAVIEDEQFDIDKVEHYKDTQPSITKLSLIKFEKHRKMEFA